MQLRHVLLVLDEELLQSIGINKQFFLHKKILKFTNKLKKKKKHNIN